MQNIRVLIADDDKEIRDLLRKFLERETYQVDTAMNGEEALRLFDLHRYSLAVFDIMMPMVDGIEVCRRIRACSNVPIVMLTARDEELDKIVGLSIGADDYVTKPFSIHELVARLKAHIRRYLMLGGGSTSMMPSREKTLLEYSGLTVDSKKYIVTKAGAPVPLTAKEFELLFYLASHPEQVFTKTQLFRQVWNSEYLEDDNTVMVHIRKLRTKIEDDPSDPQFIQTVWGIGYRFMGEKKDG
jgi:DNA-binding response OmpR family regulator